MDIPTARQRFETAMSHCDNIVTIHGNHGGGARGLRTLEPSLNRAIVVLSVAAWQSAIQDITQAALDHLQPPGAGGVGGLLRGYVDKGIKDFSTPNSENTRNLMRLVDFDPRHEWTWSQNGGRGIGRITITPADADSKIRDWLRLRHDIAHGHARLSVVSVLEDVRQRAKTWLSTRPNSNRQEALNHLKNDNAYLPSLRLKDAKVCVGTFRRLAKLTADGVVRTNGMGAANSW